jgi:hypothetical protein
MDSVLSVTSAAPDRSLLTLAELKAATGVSGSSRDAELRALSGAVEQSIARACKVVTDGTTPPTLRSETVQETFRLYHRTDVLILGRFPVVSVSSIIEAGTALTALDYEALKGAGMIRRLSGDSTLHWAHGKIVVTYTAGQATVGSDLKLAASKLAAALWKEGQPNRDPNLKRIRVEGISEREFWVPPTGDPLVPSDVLDLLGPYINRR